MINIDVPYAARLFNIKSEKRRINRPSKYRQLKKSVKISSVKTVVPSVKKHT